MTDRVDFKYLISSSNIDGEIYHCDIDRFLGIRLDGDKRNEVHKALMEIRHDEKSN